LTEPTLPGRKTERGSSRFYIETIDVVKF